MTRYAATLDEVQQAAARIDGLVHRTPVITCDTLDQRSGHRLFIKCENLQRVGAFKFRGASNAVRSLGDGLARQGVCTHSSGNHAQALARAARAMEIPAWIVMPTSAPAVKRRAVEGYGATVVPCEPNLQARETTAAEVMADTGSTMIHPYDDPRIIAGQGTAALELLDEVGELDALVAPVGGGGLMSGSCITMRGLSPSTRLIAAEPAGADDAARSLAAGQLIPQESPNTICDGLLTSLGELTWPILRDHLETIVTVDDDEVMLAMRLLWERAKTVVEPSGATPLAAVMSKQFPLPPGSRIGVILSGGNVDLDRLPWVVGR
ncbi:MAG: pyridoxal-phosphate dependent enzyme [Phycisphaerales bacterium]|nr:pyridoxal-phosphate dependent enzyme [Phycisphaerales bacterium]